MIGIATEETNGSDRVPDLKLTIIDGGGVGSVVMVGGTNVTLSEVTVRHGAASFGGGIYNAGTLTINNSTISGNSAGNGGGIYIYNSGGTLTIISSTISGNSATIGGGIGDLNNTDPMLGPLQGKGGPTPTHHPREDRIIHSATSASATRI